MGREIRSVPESDLHKELNELIEKFEKLQADLSEDGMAGSPGEGLVERMDEIEIELNRRFKAARKP